MKLVHLRVLRDLRSIRAHAAAIVVAMAVAMSIPTGLEMALRSLLETRDTFTARLALADLEVRMLPEDVRNLPDWSDIPGIQQVESRLLMPGTLRLASGSTIAALTIFVHSSTLEVNRFDVLEGRAFAAGSGEQAVVERSAATHAGVRIGDVLYITTGKRVYRHEVTGIVTSPEFLIVAANPEYFLPEKGSLAVVYTSLERVYDSLGFSMVNNLVFRFEPDANAERVKASIVEKLAGRTLERVISADQHLSRKHIEIDEEVFRIFQPAIAAVLGLMALALVLINIDRLIRIQQREIGTLLGLGYSPAQVVGSYLMVVLWLSIAGIALGVFGALAFRSAFLGIYSSAHGLAYLESHAYVDVLALGAASVLLAGFAGTVAATRALWRATPRSLMRPSFGSALEASRAFGVLSRLLSRGPLALRLAVRNVARHPRLSGTTVGAVALALAVGVAYLVCLESMGSAMMRSFSDQKWHRALSFLYPTLDDDYKQISDVDGVVGVEPFVRAQGQICGTQRTLDTSVLGIRSKASARQVNLTSGRMAGGPSEIVLGEDLARRLRTGVGDELILRLRNQDHGVKVVGIKSDVLLGESVVELSWLQGALELEDQATGAFVTLVPSADTRELDSRIQAFDFVGRSTLRTNLVDEFKTVLQDIRKLVILVAVIALGVALLFIAANMSMTMSERSVEFGTLRALGYDETMIAKVVIAEALLQVLMALVVMAPASYVMAEYLNAMATEAWFSQSTVYPVEIFLAVAAGALVLAPASLLIPLRELMRTGITQSLRARAIE